jgi:hypothetical protein
MIEVDNAPILPFWCFQEAYRSSLEENVLIRIGGGENSYGEFVSGKTFENGEIPKSRPCVGFVRRFSGCHLVFRQTPGDSLRGALSCYVRHTPATLHHDSQVL